MASGFFFDARKCDNHHFNLFIYLVGKTAPKLDLVRKHLMIEGQIEKECLVRILNEVTDIYRKFFALRNVFIRNFSMTLIVSKTILFALRNSFSSTSH